MIHGAIDIQWTRGGTSSIKIWPERGSYSRCSSAMQEDLPQPVAPTGVVVVAVVTRVSQDLSPAAA
jgi:hypothetical protein